MSAIPLLIFGERATKRAILNKREANKKARLDRRK
jgi:hypothetical protein